MPRGKIALIVASVIFCHLQVQAQEQSGVPEDSACVERDLKDVLMEMLHKTPKHGKEKSGSILEVPSVGIVPVVQRTDGRDRL